MRKTKVERERWNTYMRDYRAKLKEAKEVLSKSVHAGITVKMETRDGVLGLYAGAKFTQAQLDALEELARMEHTDSETMVEDMLHQALLEWRRIRDDRNERRKAMTLEEMDQKKIAYRERLEDLMADLLKDREEWERGVEAGRGGAEEELKDHYDTYGELTEESLERQVEEYFAYGDLEEEEPAPFELKWVDLAESTRDLPEEEVTE